MVSVQGARGSQFGDDQLSVGIGREMKAVWRGGGDGPGGAGGGINGSAVSMARWWLLGGPFTART